MRVSQVYPTTTDVAPQSCGAKTDNPLASTKFKAPSSTNKAHFQLRSHKFEAEKHKYNPTPGTYKGFKTAEIVWSEPVSLRLLLFQFGTNTSNIRGLTDEANP